MRPIHAIWFMRPPGASGESRAKQAIKRGYNALYAERRYPGIQWIQRCQNLDQATSAEGDYVFWESAWQQPDFFFRKGADDHTRIELICQEMLEVEQRLNPKQQLIFYVSGACDATWLEPLCLAASPKTHIAFSAVAGELTHDHRSPHPFWSKASNSAQLLPILNVGMVQQGGGLWPALPFDLFERYGCRLSNKAFTGGIFLTSTLPQGKGFLDCALQVGNELLTTGQSAEELIEKWFEEHQPSIDYPQHGRTLRGIRMLVLELSALREKRGARLTTEEGRAIVDGLWGRIAQFEHWFAREQSPLSEEYALFARDAKRLVLHFAYHNNVSHVNQVSDEESFWTKREGPQVQFLDTPQPGKPGSKMAEIYAINFSLKNSSLCYNPPE